MEIITGGKPFRGEIAIPPSKSISHRAIIAAGLSESPCKVHTALDADDIEATLDCLLALGVESQVEKSSKANMALDIALEGCGARWNNESILKSRESGSTLRFMIPVAMVTEGKRTFEGSGRLVERPITPYIDMFDQTGLAYEYSGRLPLQVDGVLENGTYTIPGDISSQFITGLIMALPVIDGDSSVEIEGELESASYVDLTLDVLEAFGVKVEKTQSGFSIKGNQKYKACDYEVEGDFSQAGFFIAAGLLGDEPLVLKNLSKDSKQGDKAMIEIARSMGGVIEWQGDDLVVYPSELKGAVIDLKDCPDLGPAVSVLGALAKGRTTVINAERLRIKESDRLAAMTSELKKLGAHINETPDGLIIDGVKTLMGAKVEGWNDHRIVMALTVAGIKTFGSIRIDGAEAVKKSYPQFFSDVRLLGGYAEVFNDPLVALRAEITTIDQAIVELLEKRFEVIAEIAEVKQENGIKVLDAKREEELLERLKAHAKESDGDVIESIYERILSESRKKQAERIEKN